jgi:hypothetical protein
MNSQKTNALPYVIDGEGVKGSRLHRLSSKRRLFSEQWLQTLLYEHASILPVDLIDEDFTPAISIGREIANIDNLFISPNGLITIVETKLWRNPEAHRTVVAQILDYANTLAKWDYRKLDEAVQAFMQKQHDRRTSIYKIVNSSTKNLALSEIEFQQRVEDCLNDGRFALLIVGDKIFPAATQLAEIIQSAPHMQYSIGFVELLCYRMEKAADWPLIVFPQFVARTNEVTRAIVKVVYEEKKPEIAITTPEEEKTSSGRTSFSEFIASLPSAIADIFQSYIESWIKAGHTVYWGVRGFSLRINWKGKLTTIFDAYPTYASILQEKWVKKESLPTEPYRGYREVLMTSRVISSAFAAGKRYIYYAKMSGDEIELLLKTTDEFVRGISEAAASQS